MGNDKGRLSADEIEKMVADAEKFKEDDDKQKERIAAKNGLESYCFNMKSTLDDKNMSSETCNEALNWLDNNQTAEVDEFKDKQKEVESVCNPIITKLYQQAGGNPGAAPGARCGAQSGPGFGGHNGPT